MRELDKYQQQQHIELERHERELKPEEIASVILEAMTWSNIAGEHYSRMGLELLALANQYYGPQKIAGNLDNKEIYRAMLKKMLPATAGVGTVDDELEDRMEPEDRMELNESAGTEVGPRAKPTDIPIAESDLENLKIYGIRPEKHATVGMLLNTIAIPRPTILGKSAFESLYAALGKGTSDFPIHQIHAFENRSWTEHIQIDGERIEVDKFFKMLVMSEFDYFFRKNRSPAILDRSLLASLIKGRTNEGILYEPLREAVKKYFVNWFNSLPLQGLKGMSGFAGIEHDKYGGGLASDWYHYLGDKGAVSQDNILAIIAKHNELAHAAGREEDILTEDEMRAFGLKWHYLPAGAKTGRMSE